VLTGNKFGEQMKSELKKFEIVNALASKHGLRKYLEVCTPLTGFTFEKIDTSLFELIERCVYRCSPSEDDGLQYSYRSESDSASNVLDGVFSSAGQQPVYDIIFLDPWHDYSISLADITACWRLLRAGGYLVIHDCDPPDEHYASPTHRWGGWCGETYRAYVDFVSFNGDLNFRTIDCDYGCGVIHKVAAGSMAVQSPSLMLLWMHWAAIGDVSSRKFEFFKEHRRQLLNLCSSDDFQAAV
jgi:hypothetical protein